LKIKVLCCGTAVEESGEENAGLETTSGAANSNRPPTTDHRPLLEWPILFGCVNEGKGDDTMQGELSACEIIRVEMVS
jgi:hypothetical protein